MLADLEAVERSLRHALRLQPRSAEIYNDLGSLYYRQDRIQDAIAYLSKALRLDPNCWQAHYNMANCFAKQDHWAKAALHYEQVLALHPSKIEAQLNLGLCYVALEDFVQAEQALIKTRALDPSLSEATRRLGHISIALGKTEQAIEMFEQVLEQSPHQNMAEAHHNLAILYLRSSNQVLALEHFEATLIIDPTNQTAQHFCAALKGEPAPINAPLVYVEQLFDQYAPYYNAHLKQALGYTVPSQLRNALGRSLGPNPQAGRVLDMGCGTGLCGIVFRDLAMALVGVDLSSNMIEQASRLNTYETLVQCDYQSYLENKDLQPFDIMIASDVLVYQGNLHDLFACLPKALLPGGYFVFSLETPDTGVKDYQLQSSGRFAHAPAYIHALSDRNDLRILIQEPAILRSDQQQAVMGNIMVLQRLPSK